MKANKQATGKHSATTSTDLEEEKMWHTIFDERSTVIFGEGSALLTLERMWVTLTTFFQNWKQQNKFQIARKFCYYGHDMSTCHILSTFTCKLLCAWEFSATDQTYPQSPCKWRAALIGGLHGHNHIRECLDQLLGFIPPNPPIKNTKFKIKSTIKIVTNYFPVKNSYQTRAALLLPRTQQFRNKSSAR